MITQITPTPGLKRWRIEKYVKGENPYMIEKYIEEDPEEVDILAYVISKEGEFGYLIMKDSAMKPPYFESAREREDEYYTYLGYSLSEIWVINARVDKQSKINYAKKGQ